MSLHGWPAIQMWSVVIAEIPEQRLIPGFPVITRQLASHIDVLGDPWKMSGRLRNGYPEDVSRDLLSLEGTELARRLGMLIPPRLERRLMEEARTLKRSAFGPTTPIQPLFRFGFHEAITETTEELLAREASLEAGLVRLGKEIARLKNFATSHAFFFAISTRYLTDLEEARKSLAVLQGHYRKIINSTLAVRDPSPARFRGDLEMIEAALRGLENAR